jgi:HAMP domain-containing protein
VRERFVTYDELLVLNVQGRTVARSAEGGAAPTVPAAWLSELRAGEPVLGDAFLDKASGRVALLCAAPILGANGRFVGALVAKLYLGPGEDALVRLASDPAGHMYVVAPDGTLIAGGPAARAALRTKLPADATQALLAGEGAVVTYAGFDDEDAVGVLQRIPGVPWAVVAEVPAVAAYRQLTRLRNLILLAVAALFAGLGSLAYVLGLLIIRPIARLRQGAAKVAGGDLEVDLPVVSGGEVGYLTAVFNDMVERLREGRSELERLSITDGLTGLHNRRHLNRTLTHETRRSHRHRHRFTLLMAAVVVSMG